MLAYTEYDHRITTIPCNNVHRNTIAYGRQDQTTLQELQSQGYGHGHGGKVHTSGRKSLTNHEIGCGRNYDKILYSFLMRLLGMTHREAQ